MTDDHTYDPKAIEAKWQRVWKDERTWPMVNPNLGRSVSADYLRAELVTILRMLTRQSAPIVADLPAPGAIPVALPDAPAEPSAAFQPADAAPVTAEAPGPVPAAARKNAKA